LTQLLISIFVLAQPGRRRRAPLDFEPVESFDLGTLRALVRAVYLRVFAGG